MTFVDTDISWRDFVAWLEEAPSRTQSIGVVLLLDRDLWGRPVLIRRIKGWLMVSVGPFQIEFGG